MCFEEIHLHDLYFDEKKLKQKYYTFAKKGSKITFLNVPVNIMYILGLHKNLYLFVNHFSRET